MDQSVCETCWHYDYDEEADEYYCRMELDEDEGRERSGCTDPCGERHRSFGR